MRLIAQSATLFDNRGLGLEFVADGAGVATHLLDRHVSGDYRFERMKEEKSGVATRRRAHSGWRAWPLELVKEPTL